MASTQQQEPFLKLSNALDTLFERYEGLKQSLSDLSETVFKIAIDARDEAVKINILGRETRYSLVFYLNTLKDMCNAMEQPNFDDCKEQADTAIYTMNDLVSQTQADDMFKALEAVATVLHEQEQNGKQNSVADVDKVIEKATQGASSILKSITLRLLRRIKDELHKALDDSKLFVNSGALEEQVKKVRQTIADAKNAYNENILALDNIISTMERLSDEGKQEETFINSLKSNAVTLGNNCEEKLPTCIDILKRNKMLITVLTIDLVKDLAVKELTGENGRNTPTVGKGGETS
ncbi:hypothetical protein OS493_013205 [Desmophyllum pertusum]|uniref:Uncharacterized protein n=1 Tax=Desmophyllum pertusum TaxID=174260 RepID=A0A9W9YRJ9_9CNID|nr:hypothetical protein OS493_013205 [Desmophyllum pertusum]